MTWQIVRYNNLKSELTEFLKDNGVEFFGVEGPERGSKICSVYIKSNEVDKIKNLSGKGNRFHNFYFSCAYWVDSSAKYMVNCKKI